MMMKPKIPRSVIPVRIRVATSADAASIARVHVDAWKSTYAGIVPDHHLHALSYKRGTEKVKNWIEQPYPGTKIFVAEIDGDGIVGFATGGFAKEKNQFNEGELHAIYILGAYQHRGIGRSLVARVASHLQTLGLQGMVTWVLLDNPAKRFYESLGGTRTGEQTIEIGGKPLMEVSYRWIDLNPLLRN